MAEHRMNATGKIMISIECENFERAQQAYKSWLGYLLDREPECVEGFNDYVLYVDVDRIFRYIFFDWRLESVLSEFSDQMLYQDEFFFLEGVSQDYWKMEREVW